eukprot:TRINITY_DN16574_c1_g1_i1.p1 TRINITY_DN16574_c1_g1~~TRINITY_DN16574_c1_g1_i1.p1  ORF type:complete len:595 (+),score=202.92 TRINITY_DN16574_c1_g1_i1:78-1787(+)
MGAKKSKHTAPEPACPPRPPDALHAPAPHRAPPAPAPAAPSGLPPRSASSSTLGARGPPAAPAPAGREGAAEAARRSACGERPRREQPLLPLGRVPLTAVPVQPAPRPEDCAAERSTAPHQEVPQGAAPRPVHSAKQPAPQGPPRPRTRRPAPRPQRGAAHAAGAGATLLAAHLRRASSSSHGSSAAPDKRPLPGVRPRSGSHADPAPAPAAARAPSGAPEDRPDVLVAVRATQSAAERQAAQLEAEAAQLRELLEEERGRAREAARRGAGAAHLEEELRQLRRAAQEADLCLERRRVEFAEEARQRQAAEVALLRQLQAQQGAADALERELARCEGQWEQRVGEALRHAECCEDVVAQSESSAAAWRRERDNALRGAAAARDQMYAEAQRTRTIEEQNRALRWQSAAVQQQEFLRAQRCEEEGRLRKALDEVRAAGGIEAAPDQAVTVVAARMRELTQEDAVALLGGGDGPAGERAEGLLRDLDPGRVHVAAAKRALQRRCDVVRHAAAVASGTAPPPAPQPPAPGGQGWLPQDAAAAAARYVQAAHVHTAFTHTSGQAPQWHYSYRV